MIKWDATNLHFLISLYQRNALPEDVKLTFVPIRKTAYGDFELVRDFLYHPKAPKNIPDVTTETVTLQEYIVNGETVFAAYGEQSRNLIIGKERQ